MLARTPIHGEPSRFQIAQAEVGQHLAESNTHIRAALHAGDMDKALTLISRKVGLRIVRDMQDTR